MLTTVEAVRSVPGMKNLAALPDSYLNMLIQAADAAIKTYCKRDLELQAYEDFYNGDLTPNIILRQWPVWEGITTIASGSNNAVLPVTTLNVVSTTGFPSSTGLNPIATPFSLTVQTSPSAFTRITYTGTTSTSFTGCSGGTGTLLTGNRVSMPCVWTDPNGYAGQTSGGFVDGTINQIGTTFMVDVDKDTKSYRGLLKRVGGQGVGFPGFYPENYFSGKLAAYRLPVWPRGLRNIKVAYAAGYHPDHIPADLKYAATMMVVYMSRNLPKGQPLSSEGLGAYSYSILQGSNDIPEIGALPRTLAQYREVSW